MDHRTNLSFLLYTVAEICIFNGMAQSSALEAHIITNTRRLAGGPTTSVVYSAYIIQESHSARYCITLINTGLFS